MDLPALDPLWQGPLPLALRALIEIPLLSYLGYRVILVIRGTRAAPVALGVVLLGLLYLVSGLLRLETIRWASLVEGVTTDPIDLSQVSESRSFQTTAQLPDPYLRFLTNGPTVTVQVEIQ